jgi:hypothetical protein
MRLVACALVLLAGCKSRVASPAPEAVPHTVEIVTAPAGAKGTPYSMAFEDQQDGTGVFTRFVQGAEKDGALTVSELALYLTAHDGAELVTCRRDVVVGPPPAVPAGSAFPRLVTKDVTDIVKECTTTPRTVTRTMTVYKQVYNAATKQNVKFPEQKEVTETVNDKTCVEVPKTQQATRYQDEIEAGFIPPRLDSLRPTYTKLELSLGPPSCAPATAGKPRHRIEGTIHRN